MTANKQHQIDVDAKHQLLEGGPNSISNTVAPFIHPY